jgi:molybdopterin-guanine dinucleotide biosynthesis protein MobB
MLPRLLGFAAASGTGKTSLLKSLIPGLRAQGLRLGLIKLTHHDVELDRPGKDSYELRKAGASQVLLAGSERWTLVRDFEQPREPELDAMLAQLDLEALDLVLVEGLRHGRLPKIEVHRPSLGRPLLYPHDSEIIAIATDQPLKNSACPPQLDLNQPQQVLDFVLEWLRS